MSNTITFTSPLNNEDYSLLHRLLSDESPATLQERKKKQQVGVRQDIFGEKKILFPKMHGHTKETILTIIKHFEGHATIPEMLTVTNIPLGSLAQTCYDLKHDGILDTNGTKPKHYYLRADGDPELHAALKNAGKTVVMR